MTLTTIRKRPAHFLPRTDGGCTLVFVTCCTKNRAKWLADPAVHELVRKAWMAADRWMVGRYVLMPDHLHFFCAPGGDPCALSQWMGYWRSVVTKRLGALRGALWQRDYWDRQLRKEESYAASWDYVRHNPVRAGLVTSADDWPYQGQMAALDWFD